MIQFRISIQFSSIWPIDRTLSGATTPGQWRSTLHSPKLQHYWKLTIRLLSVISWTRVGGCVLPLCSEAVGIFCSPSPPRSRLGKRQNEETWKSFKGRNDWFSFFRIQPVKVLIPFLVGCVLRHINLGRLFNAKSIFIHIISSISNNSV